MKRRFLVISAFLLSIAPFVKGQEVMDAYNLSRTELTGTARAMSMGGAFGALGGDVTGVAINPAGIGVYKSSEVVATLNFQNTESKAMRPEGDYKQSKFNVNANNVAFVGTFPLYNDVAPYLNVGFSYNRLKSFNRKFATKTGGMEHSLSDFLAGQTEGLSIADLRNAEWDGSVNWLPMFGYDAGIISPISNDANETKYKSTYPTMAFDNDMAMQEKGSVNSYDFNIGTTFEDMLSVGLTISITDINYKMSSSYVESFWSGDLEGWFNLQNEFKTEGTGWKVALGTIFKPIPELRIGLAYHSPTWYNMTDYSYGYMDYDYTGIIKNMHLSEAQKDLKTKNSFDTGSEWARWDYKLRTPDKWVFSLAGVLGKNAILSLDYELTDYGKAKFDDRTYPNDYSLVNTDIKSYHKLASTIRVGGEYRFTPQFSMRAGYSWQQNPYKSDFPYTDSSEDVRYNVYTKGSIPQYVLYGDTHYITWGLGYRFTKNVYTDLAFVYRTQDSDLYMYDAADKIDLKDNAFQGALTLGLRF